MTDIEVVTGKPAEITLTALGRQSAELEASGGASGDSYAGPYEVTPTDEIQILRTQQKLMTRNIVINPIPSNYGLITWNGSVLTVS